jgi:hypothetical protein
MKKITWFIALIVIIMGFGTSAYAYQAMAGPTGVLLYKQGKAYDGYTVFAPIMSQRTFMIDMEGNIVHTWDSQYYPGLYAELLPNGNLLRAGRGLPITYCGIDGIGGYIEEINWDGKVVWSFKDMFTKNEVQHHCFDRMPNGNTMILGWERVKNEEMIAKGRDPKTIPTKSVKNKGVYHRDFWLDFIWEVNPAGKIVWEWHIKDHLGKGPDQFDPNYILPMATGEIYATYDWSHLNTLVYVPETDQVLTNSRNLSEVYLIDHKTGKLQYRWGNPCAYGAGKCPSYFDVGDQKIFGSHDARWLGNGRFSVFDNGSENPEGTRSRIFVVNTKTNEIEWKYEPWDQSSFFTHRQGAAQPLPNGNWFVTSSNVGHFFEITKKGEVVWDFVNPLYHWENYTKCTIRDDDKDFQLGAPDNLANITHRAYRYGKDYPGLKGKDLTPKGKMAKDCPEMWKILKY